MLNPRSMPGLFTNNKEYWKYISVFHWRFHAYESAVLYGHQQGGRRERESYAKILPHKSNEERRGEECGTYRAIISRNQKKWIWGLGAFQKHLCALKSKSSQLTCSPVNKIDIFQCMGKIFCVGFQWEPLKFTQNILPIYSKIRFL